MKTLNDELRTTMGVVEKMADNFAPNLKHTLNPFGCVLNLKK